MIRRRKETPNLAEITAAARQDERLQTIWDIQQFLERMAEGRDLAAQDAQGRGDHHRAAIERARAEAFWISYNELTAMREDQP